MLIRRLGYREEQVLATIRAAAAAGSSPPYRVICDATGLGTRSEVRRIVKRLERRGLVTLASPVRRFGLGIVRLT